MIPALGTLPAELDLVVGQADGRAYDALLPGCRSVWVIGNGGDRLFKRFDEDLTRDPRWRRLAHPLDAWVRSTLGPALDAVGGRVVWCAAEETTFLDFRRLAVEAGLGWRSRLGLILHPTYGPWWALRAAVLTVDDGPTPGPSLGPPPCDGCPGPCAVACAPGAFTPGWDVGRCASAIASEPACRRGCAARRACPVGADRAYAPRAEAWHQHADGRKPENPG